MDIPLQAATSFDSSSELSYSPGPSYTSTRNTSPDRASTNASFDYSSPSILSIATAHIEYTSNTLLDQPINMDKNSFQFANDRRNKLVNERGTGTHYQPSRQQQHQQQQLASPQLQIIQPSHRRSITSANWRSPTSEDTIELRPRTIYSPFDTAGPSTPLQHPPMFITPFPNTRRDQYHRLPHATASATSYPSLGSNFDTHLDSSFAYCYDRGNGQYTRLIPADMLPPLQNIPAIQQGYAGMLVVPQPRGLPPNGQSSNTEPVAVRSRIDNIVATTPLTTNPLSPSSSNIAALGHRRPKIYCDKWVHEGVCAFTQQGCKYKHEMPSDKLTQHQLGLFHGYPQWWKKHQADLSRQRDAPLLEAPKNGGQSNELRTSNERYIGHSSRSIAGGGSASYGGLTSDAGRQFAWRHSGEYGSDSPALGPASSMGQATSKGISGPMRIAIAENTPDRNLSPRPISYGSPFGPIAPPARSNAAAIIRTESTHGASAGHSPLGSRYVPYGMRRSSPVGHTSILPTSNPYASLEAFDDSDDQNASEGIAYTQTPRVTR
ncbi:hypothetical protein F5B22DRAFT_653351 [Xylaria bambusicola]|uniref:uncharacterized protein n=1 Tax=Xylaria bambusicola TaxID=326684 RepID=UPI0020085D43|nr:uncharacterized protein F5B22DRAFT_653351 [Xylaria bambusicola]KAI0528281.1 hypothetical protein F5B22DRAFT_653351 [Xylaria bambusicola]